MHRHQAASSDFQRASSTLNGLLSLLLLLTGIAMILAVERRAVRPDRKPSQWLLLPASAITQRSTRLARLQLSPATPKLSAATPVPDRTDLPGRAA
jgi:hypothetical protein